MKGSYYVIQVYKKLIEKYGLTEKVELKASFCMKMCLGGIGATFDGVPVNNLNTQNCEDIFIERILNQNGNNSA
jgi:hypothetical protein